MDSKAKSILFLQGRFTVGGVERVTVLLANAFAERGYRVVIAVFRIEKREMLQLLRNGIIVRELGFPVYSLRNLLQLRNLMRIQGVTHVINQWAFPFPVTAMLRFAMPRRARLVSVFHTMPNQSRRINESVGLKRRLVTWLVRANSRLVYRFCHAYVVLSNSYRSVFEEFTGIRNPKKLHAIPNPHNTSSVLEGIKENIVLYVGRLAETEKRVDRVIDVWRGLCECIPEWRLEILGDGPDRTRIEEMARDLPRVAFRGFQNPEAWYAKSKILLLTSDFEGFPMTLVEAMAARCVPVVYGSFSAACEIVVPESGIVVPTPWKREEFVESVLSLIKDEDRLNAYGENAKKSVSRFDIAKVVGQYDKLLEEC